MDTHIGGRNGLKNNQPTYWEASVQPSFRNTHGFSESTRWTFNRKTTEGKDNMDQKPALQRFWARHGTGVLLAVILFVAAGLRFWNVEHDSDPSRVFSGDARKKFHYAKLLVTEGRIPTEPNERYELYRQPLFLIRSYGAIWKAMDLMGVAGNDEQMRKGFTAYMILLSLGTVVLVFLLGEIVLGERNQAMLAALLFAAFPVNVAGSLYVKEDIPLMFWFTAAMAAMSALVQTGRKGYYLWTGPLIGLAIGTKYPGLLLLPVFLLAHLIVVFKVPKGDRIKVLLAWQVFASLGLAVLAFLIFNSHAITEWPDFLKGFLSRLRYAKTGHRDGTAIRGLDYWWTFYLRYAILPGITFPATLFFLAGLVVSFIRRNRPAVLISVAVLISYFVFENSLAKPFPFFARYLHFAYPLMALLAAFAFFKLWCLLRQGTLTRLIGITVGLILVLSPLCKSTILAAGARPDTRFLAERWIDENLPPGSRIYMGCRCSFPQDFGRDKFQMKYDGKIHRKSVQQMKEEKAEYLVVSSFRYDRWRFSRKSSATAREAFRAYVAFDRELELIKVFQPRFSFQSYGQHNPVIRIYKIPH